MSDDTMNVPGNGGILLGVATRGAPDDKYGQVRLLTGVW